MWYSYTFLFSYFLTHEYFMNSPIFKLKFFYYTIMDHIPTFGSRLRWKKLIGYFRDVSPKHVTLTSLEYCLSIVHLRDVSPKHVTLTSLEYCPFSRGPGDTHFSSIIMEENFTNNYTILDWNFALYAAKLSTTFLLILFNFSG